MDAKMASWKSTGTYVDEVPPPGANIVLFVLSVVGGHWYAAFESASRSTLLAASAAATAATASAGASAAAAAGVPAAPFAAALDPWVSRVAPVLLVLALWLHWDAAFFLGKYFDRLVVPKAVVMVGPYRSLRHPLYASYVLLFCAFCLSLHRSAALSVTSVSPASSALSLPGCSSVMAAVSPAASHTPLLLGLLCILGAGGTRMSAVVIDFRRIRRLAVW
ncbi:unnamed protein product [Closterium sp. NIES-54]